MQCFHTEHHAEQLGTGAFKERLVEQLEIFRIEIERLQSLGHQLRGETRRQSRGNQGHQLKALRQPVAISGHQWQSVAIRAIS